MNDGIRFTIERGIRQTTIFSIFMKIYYKEIIENCKISRVKSM